MRLDKSLVILGTFLLLATGFASSVTVEEYNGVPRVWYDYSGDETSECVAWKAGEQTTRNFQSDTDMGEGTASVEQKPMYDGYPRVFYEYTGDETSEYEAWKAGEQTTRNFQSDTDMGEGTASLELRHLFQDYPRAWYDYTGDEQNEYEEWKNGNQDTDSFSFNTDRGEGTAALELNPSCSDSSGEDSSSDDSDSSSDETDSSDEDSDDSDSTGDEPPETPEDGGDTGTYQIELAGGWNMISAPSDGNKNQFSMEEVTVDFSIVETSDGSHAYGFPNSNGGYAQTDTISAKSGYWIQTQSSCTAEIGSEAMSEGAVETDVAEGWNLISAESEVSIADMAGECTFLPGGGTVAYWYNPEQGQYDTLDRTSNLNPLKGYWVQAESQCSLGGNGPPSTPE